MDVVLHRKTYTKRDRFRQLAADFLGDAEAYLKYGTQLITPVDVVITRLQNALAEVRNGRTYKPSNEDVRQELYAIMPHLRNRHDGWLAGWHYAHEDSRLSDPENIQLHKMIVRSGREWRGRGKASDEENWKGQDDNS